MKRKNIKFLYVTGLIGLMALSLAQAQGDIDFRRVHHTDPLSLSNVTLSALDRQHLCYDFDGDGATDVLMIGRMEFNGNTVFSQMNFNRQGGLYMEAQPLLIDTMQTYYASAADFDGDGDIDLMKWGRYIGFRNYLVLNDGEGNFTWDGKFQFPLVNFPKTVPWDADHDGDVDLLIYGLTNSGSWFSALYANDGTGNFSEMESANLPSLSNSSVISIGDVDGDDLDDLLVFNKGVSPKISINAGGGNFEEATEIEALSAYEGLLSDLKDIDGDEDLDLLVEVNILSGSARDFHIYANDGSGVFSKVDQGIDLTEYWGAQLADFDDDDMVDLCLFGGDDDGEEFRVYKNNGSGLFNVKISLPFGTERVQISQLVQLKDDGQSSVILGLDDGTLYLNEVYHYTNEGWEAAHTPIFERTELGDVAILDLDGDQDMDLMKLQYGPGYDYLLPYYNDGKGRYEAGEKWLTPTDKNIGVMLEAHDLDDNGLDDLIWMDKFGTNVIYWQTSAGEFEVGSDNGLATFGGNSDFWNMFFEDMDADGYVDFVLQGERSVTLFWNDGEGNFSADTDLTFRTPGSNATVVVADVNGDDHLDIILSHDDSNDGLLSYINDGEGGFTEVQHADLSGVAQIVLEDFDNDGDTDLLIAATFGDGGISRVSAAEPPVTRYYDNDGSGKWTQKYEFELFGYGKMYPSDIDGDGNIDVWISGITSSEYKTEAWLNDGKGSFTKDDISLYAFDESKIKLTDIDNDGREDLMIIDRLEHHVYRNVTSVGIVGDCEAIKPKRYSEHPQLALFAIGNTDSDTPFTLSGTHEINWTYEYAEDIKEVVLETVEVRDDEAPKSDLDKLSVVKGTCEIETLEAPTATDHCDGLLTGVTDVELPILESMSITWVFTDEAGNTSEQIQQVEVEACPAVPLLVETKTQMIVHPNPTNGSVLITWSEAPLHTHLRLLSLDGQELQNFAPLNGMEQVLDLSEYPVGIYLLEAQSNNQRTLKKIIIQ